MVLLLTLYVLVDYKFFSANAYSLDNKNYLIFYNISYILFLLIVMARVWNYTSFFILIFGGLAITLICNIVIYIIHISEINLFVINFLLVFYNTYLMAIFMSDPVSRSRHIMFYDCGLCFWEPGFVSYRVSSSFIVALYYYIILQFFLLYHDIYYFITIVTLYVFVVIYINLFIDIDKIR